MADVTRTSLQGLPVFIVEVATLHTLANDLPGEELIRVALAVQVEGRVEIDLFAGRLEAFALGKRCQGPADSTITTGEEPLKLCMAQ